MASAATIPQDGRELRIATPLGDDVLAVARIDVVEEISVPFLVRAELISRQNDIKFDDIVGKPVTISLEAGGTPRFFNGIVGRFQMTGSDTSFARYYAEIVPWLWLLTRSADCRIFQEMTAPDILKKVFDDHGFADYKVSLSETYDAREYCVQYRETAFDFVSRLMEEEGIHYFFTHENGRHVLQLADSPGASPDCPGFDTIEFNSTGAGGAIGPFVESLTCQQEVRTSRVSLNDFNFETPLNSLFVKREEDAKHAALEVYDYPGSYIDTGAGERVAKIRMEEQFAPRILLSGTSKCRAFSAGHKTTIKEHPRGDLNQAMLLVRTIHHASQEGEFQAGRGGEPFSYSNEFTAIPHKTTFRPRRSTPVPRIPGTQTAMVVGPSGEEIHTDKYGRVKLQFHWDREGKMDENASCWVRVASNWAGKNWGAIFLPRIGHEVIVEFLEGNPDRPIITGRVYNAEAMPPFELPGNKTQSGMKSRSSPGAGTDNLNVMRFEDKLGEEQIFVQAEKNHQQRVKNDSTEFIGNDRHLIVKNDRKRLIEANEHLTINADRMESIAGNDNRTVEGDQIAKISGSDNLDVASDRMAKIANDDNLDVGMNLNTKAGMDISGDAGMNIHLKAGMNTGIDSGMNVHLKGGMNVVVEAGLMLTLKAGPGFITIGPTGVSISGPMVMINSGGAAGAGSGASPKSPAAPAAPDAPEEPDEAIEATPTDKAEARSAPTRESSPWSLESITLKAAADSGAAFTRKPGAS